jgi:hypothetical protein
MPVGAARMSGVASPAVVTSTYVEIARQLPFEKQVRR